MSWQAKISAAASSSTKSVITRRNASQETIDSQCFYLDTESSPAVSPGIVRSCRGYQIDAKGRWSARRRSDHVALPRHASSRGANVSLGPPNAVHKTENRRPSLVQVLLCRRFYRGGLRISDLRTSRRAHQFLFLAMSISGANLQSFDGNERRQWVAAIGVSTLIDRSGRTDFI